MDPLEEKLRRAAHARIAHGREEGTRRAQGAQGAQGASGEGAASSPERDLGPLAFARRHNQDHHAFGNKDAAPARFSLVCTSPSGNLCLFEDAEGHYTAVRSARLA